MVKISELPTLSAADPDDTLGIVDTSAGTTKKVTQDALIPDGSLSISKLDGGETAGNLSTDTSGNVTASSTHAFKVSLGVNQQNSIGQVIKLNTKHFDLSDAFNTTTWRFIAPEDGIYSFSWALYSSGATKVVSGIYVNGAEYARGSWVSSSSGFLISTGSTTTQLTADDYVDLRNIAMEGSNTTVLGAATTYLSGHRAG